MRAETHTSGIMAISTTPQPIRLPSFRLPWLPLAVTAAAAFLATTWATRPLQVAYINPAAAATQPTPVPPTRTAVTIPATEVEAQAADPEPATSVRVELLHLDRGETLIVELPFDGKLDADTAKQVARFLRCKRTGRWRLMRSGVLAMLAALGREYPGHVIEVLSGYRSEKSASRHREGRAIDLRVRDVPLKQVRDFLWSTFKEEVGIGYYPESNFLHMDSRPGYDRIAWTERRNKPMQYNPRWARQRIAEAD